MAHARHLQESMEAAADILIGRTPKRDPAEAVERPDEPLEDGWIRIESKSGPIEVQAAAGTPILADESKAILRVPDELARQIHPQADFYVVVRGDSMSSVGYRTGDIIAIKRTPNAADGDVVMARIGTEITLKCFRRPSEDRVELRPCSKNPEHCAIVIDEQTEDWEIVGVVVGAMIGPPR